MIWAELCQDKRLRDLPYKIETNRFGKIEISPMRNIQGYFTSEIAQLLKKLMRRGKTIVACGIDTADGTKVADVTWASDKTFAIIKKEFSCSVAPEVCVEVLSPFNSKAEIEFKRQLYFRAGAEEYWICDEEGALQFFNLSGQLKKSRLCPSFPSSIES